jgi:hypothetical protein
MAALEAERYLEAHGDGEEEAVKAQAGTAAAAAHAVTANGGSAAPAVDAKLQPVAV